MGLKLVSGIYDIKGMPMIEDVGIDCHVSSNPYLPDYVIPGYWIEDSLAPRFLANENGPHLLYITGIPHGVQDWAERGKFRFSEKLFISYWEDNNQGYLFQVVDKDISVKHLMKNI